MMHSVLWALTWEYWKSGRLGFAGGLGAMIAIPGVLYGLSLLYGTGRHPHQEMPLLFFGFAGVALLICMLAVLRVQADRSLGFPTRFYALPVSTGIVVSWKLVITGLTASALYLACAACLNGLVDARWPYWGPALLFAAVVTIAQAANWTTSHNRTLQVCVTLALIVGIGYWFLTRFVIGSESASYRAFWELTPSEAATLVATVVAASAVAYFAVLAGRRGEALRFRIGARSARTRSRMLLQVSPVRSQSFALFLAEWRQKGWQMPMAALAGVAVMVFTYAMGGMQSDTLLWSLLALFGWGVPLLGLLFALSIGRVQPDPDKSFGRFDAFAATRPVSDTMLARAVLANGAASLAAAYVVTAVGIAVALNSMVQFGDASAAEAAWTRAFGAPSASAARSYMVLCGLSFVLAWTLMAMTICLLLTGRVWLSATVLGIVVASVLMLLGVVQTGLNQQIVRAILEGWRSGLGIVSFGFTAWAYAYATWKRLLPIWSMLTAAILWAIAANLTVLSFWPTGAFGFPSAHVIYLCGLWALPLLPTAAGPLAVSWNRHR